MQNGYFKKIKLLDVIDNKNNNFNLIRMLAAAAVIISHSYALALGGRGFEPVNNFLGISLGEIAVNIFFITSGLLVCRSLCFRSNLTTFIMSRCLRIYPALIVSIVFCVCLGALLSTYSISEYMVDNELFNFIFYNGTMVLSDAQELPGLFYNAPYDRAVNGSLWTLPWELRMYLVLLGLGAALTLSKHLSLTVNFIPSAILIMAIVSFAFYMGFHFSNNFHWFYYKFFRFATVFFLGGSLYVLRRYIVMDIKWLLYALVALVLAYLVNEDTFFVAFIMLSPYIVLCLAYMPQGSILNYNKLGDYSYGTYIYAWPIQQTLAVTLVGITPYQMMAYAFVLTLLLATFSWHLIEKPSMKLKRHFT